MSFFVSKMRKILIVEGVLVIASLLLFLLPLKNYSYTADEMESEEGMYLESFMDCTEGGFYIDNSLVSEKGVTDSGKEIPWATVVSPKTDLRFGSYNVTFKLINSDHSNTYTCSSLYNTFPVIQGRVNTGIDEIETADDSMVITLNSALNVNEYQVTFNYRGDGFMYVYGLEIQETNWWKIFILLWIVLLSVVIDMFLYLGEKKDRFAQGMMVAVIALAVISSLPVFDPYLVGGHDSSFHRSRIEALVAGLRSGQFPVRIPSAWIDGKGYAASIFYGDLFLMLPALLRILGASLQFSYKAYLFAINLLTSYVAYKCFSKILKSKKGMLLATIVYVLSPYRLVCLYSRDAVGEYTAMAFMPLVLWGLLRIYQDESNDNSIKAKVFRALPLTIGITGIVQCHFLSFVIVVIFSVVFALVCFKKTFKLKVFTDCLLAVGMVVLVNLWFIVPFIQIMADGIGSATVHYDGRFRSNATYLWQLLSLFPNGGFSMSIEEAVPMVRGQEMTVAIGPAYLPVILYAFLRLTGFIKRDKNEAPVKMADILSIVAAVTVFMETPYFPWDAVKQFSSIGNMITKNIQFPYRFLSITMICLAIVCGLLLEFVSEGMDELKRYAGIYGGALAVLVVVSASYYMTWIGTSTGFEYVPDTFKNFSVMGAEYLPGDITQDFESISDPYFEEGIQVSGWNRNNGKIEVSAVNGSSSEKLLSVPFIYYRGYRAKDATGQALNVIKDHNAFVGVALPAGFSGDVTVYYSEPGIWRVTEIISLLSVAFLVCLWFMDRRRKAV